jgi:hypothetical protein
MMSCSSELVAAPSVDVRLAEPPRISEIRLPGHLIKTSAGGSPNPASKAVKIHGGASCGGLLFLTYLDLRSTPGLYFAHVSSVTRFVCNPVTRELSRLPDPIFSAAQGSRMGFLTQADRGRGPPDRFAVATMLPAAGRDLMVRFLSETGEWEFMEFSPSHLPLDRVIKIDQEPLAFGGRMWWVDLSWCAISTDPYSGRPELSFVQLPAGSVLPPLKGDIRYRRVGVSEGRLRYVEVSQEPPFFLSSFVLDDEGSSWTLEHRVVLNKIWGRSMWIPLQTSGDADIVLIDPLKSSVVYLRVMSQIVVVDMEREEVIESCPCSDRGSYIPCLLPHWLGSSRIPYAGTF